MESGLFIMHGQLDRHLLPECPSNHSHPPPQLVYKQRGGHASEHSEPSQKRQTVSMLRSLEALLCIESKPMSSPGTCSSYLVESLHRNQQLPGHSLPAHSILSAQRSFKYINVCSGLVDRTLAISHAPLLTEEYEANSNK
jgi:hypothetical protein